MYAIIINGGKQYKIKTGKKILLEKINKPIGQKIKLKKIIVLFNKKNIFYKKKTLNLFTIKAKIISHIKDKKIKIIKFKKRKNYTKTQGHRQKLTQIQILSIKKKEKKNGT